MMPKPIALTADEVADMLRVTRQQVYKLARDGKLPHFKVGRWIRFHRSEIERLLRGEASAS